MSFLFQKRKDGSQIKREGFRFTTYFVSVKINIKRLDDIEMQTKICISFQQFRKFQGKKICSDIRYFSSGKNFLILEIIVSFKDYRVFLGGMQAYLFGDA